jgi:hypothetical protein
MSKKYNSTQDLPSDFELKNHAVKNLSKFKKTYLDNVEKVKKMVGEKSFSLFSELNDLATEDHADFLAEFYLEFNPEDLAGSNLIRYILVNEMNNSRNELRGLPRVFSINGIEYKL